MSISLENIQEYNTALQVRFADKLKVNHQLNRQLVSFQANKNKPFYRWFKYKEGFSEALVQHLLDHLRLDTGRLLDPFSGAGTTLFVASERGLDVTGIELLPLGCEIVEVCKLTKNADVVSLRSTIHRWQSEQPWKHVQPTASFPHIRITKGAFAEDAQQALNRYLTALKSETPSVARVLRFAAMSVLEEISYTRKDGQYLRWDYRSERKQGKRPFNKGKISNFDDAIIRKLNEIAHDLRSTGFKSGLFGGSEQRGEMVVLQGSSLNILPTLAAKSFDGIITSPPYANRYDYTRTYALELALLGIGETEIRELRQAMISCTVENRDKTGLDRVFQADIYERALTAFKCQQALQSILGYLELQKNAKALNNPGIPRMIRNYFFEMALIIFDSARILKPGSPFVMVNDNVRYGGAIIPVDLILCDFAEQAGFDIEVIWVLPTGKGNSSQQMGLHGREEVRKCIYIWRR